MHLKENIFFDLDLGVKVTRNIVKFPLHHVIYAPAKFEFAMSNSFGGDAFTKKIHFWPSTLTLGAGSHKLLSSTSTSCILCTPAKLEVAISNGKRGDALKENIYYLTFDLDFGVTLGPRSHETLSSTL